MLAGMGKLTAQEIQTRAARARRVDARRRRDSAAVHATRLCRRDRLRHRLAFDAEAADHHPDILINYKRVTLTYTTHSEGGLTHEGLRRRARGNALDRWTRASAVEWSASVAELKNTYSAREVAAMTGLTARQLQWWDTHRCSRRTWRRSRTERGGYTERRYTPVDLLELLVLAELRRQGLSVGQLRRLLDTLRDAVRRAAVRDDRRRRPADADDRRPRRLRPHVASGDLFNLLRNPQQPLLMLGQEAICGS